MKLVLDPLSIDWFIRELSLGPGAGVRFFARYGGESSFQPGYSLGLAVEPPQNVAASFEIDGRTFYIREEDTWYFDGGDLQIVYDVVSDTVNYVIHCPYPHPSQSTYVEA